MTAAIAPVLNGVAALAIVWLGLRVMVSGFFDGDSRRRVADSPGSGALSRLVAFIGLVVAGSVALQCGILNTAWAAWLVAVVLFVAAIRLAPGFGVFLVVLLLLSNGGSQ